jgi:hypothetical protein
MSSHITHADLQAALPDILAPVRIPGLLQRGERGRDAWSMPHIRADAAPDAFFARGCVSAQVRRWHMDDDRHGAPGRWAAWLAPQHQRLALACVLASRMAGDMVDSGLPCGALCVTRSQDFLLFFVDQVRYTYVRTACQYRHRFRHAVWASGGGDDL